MKAGKQGAWKRTAQAFAEKQARALSRSVWLAFWKKFDRQRKTQQKR